MDKGKTQSQQSIYNLDLMTTMMTIENLKHLLSDIDEH